MTPAQKGPPQADGSVEKDRRDGRGAPHSLAEVCTLYHSTAPQGPCFPGRGEGSWMDRQALQTLERDMVSLLWLQVIKPLCRVLRAASEVGYYFPSAIRNRGSER